MKKSFYIGFLAVVLLPVSNLTFAVGGGEDVSSTVSVSKNGQVEIHTISIQVASASDLDVNNLQIFSANPELIEVKNISVLGNIIYVNVDLSPGSKVGNNDDVIDVIEIVGIDNITGVFINPGGQQSTATAFVNTGSDSGEGHHTDQVNQISSSTEMVLMNHQQTNYVSAAAPSSGSSAFVRDMLVYPNPAKDELGVVTVGEILGKSINIIDMSGKVHIEVRVSENSHKTSIDITSLPAGIYLVNLTATNGKSYIQKFYKVD